MEGANEDERVGFGHDGEDRHTLIEKFCLVKLNVASSEANLVLENVLLLYYPWKYAQKTSAKDEWQAKRLP